MLLKQLALTSWSPEVAEVPAVTSRIDSNQQKQMGTGVLPRTAAVPFDKNLTPDTNKSNKLLKLTSNCQTETPAAIIA